jgi:hypothetical protein
LTDHPFQKKKDNLGVTGFEFQLKFIF